MTAGQRCDDLDLVARRALRPLGAARVFLNDRKQWTVEEVVDETSSRSLIFASNGVARRVRVFPEDWRSLPDEVLYALSLHR